MIVKEYNNAQAFLDDNEATLLEQEAVSQLILYNAYQNLTVIGCRSCLFGTVQEEEKNWLYFCNVAPYKLAIYSAVQEDLSEAVSILAEYLGNNHIVISGINARYDICQEFMEQYKKRIPCTFALKMGVDIMEIREVNDIKVVEGLHRLATSYEDKMITDWMIQYHIEALDSEMDYEAALKKADQLIKEGRIYVYENAEQNIVSMAAAARELVHGIAITYLFTPEEFRGKGYAASNIYYLSKELLEEGYAFCSLFVDKKNPVSARAYEKVGYRVVGDNYEYIAIPEETNA
ncbi:MAG: GNAT family N-acetyltransferase [Lachnospiraceae bacterium]|nr:GNAT family N-acetyltransferase [Lachnospiraceae bacterium]